jgi:predicted ATP-grasp superfamily ATP-dependent carboligase
MRPRTPPVALVTDCIFRKAVAAVRSLGRRGVRVVACETTALAPGLLSRYAWRRVVHPPLSLDRAGFLDALEDACRRFQPSTILAMEEETLLAILDERERFESLGVRLPYASAGTIRRFSDKLWTLERARSLGIETPRTWLAPAEASGPLVVKPRRGSGAYGVRYVNTAEAAREGELIQERLRGDGLGVSLLYSEDARLVASFTHRRLREWPSTGGASTLRESAHAPEIEEQSRRLLESEGFVGPAMVEWKVDHRDGRPKLLEVNPRFWGSLALAIRAGVDFPWLLLEGAPLTLSLSKGERAYQAGVRARWFLPGDFMHFAERGDWRGLARSLWPGREPAAPDDLFASDDLGAALGAVLSGIPFALRPEFSRFRRLARA